MLVLSCYDWDMPTATVAMTANMTASGEDWRHSAACATSDLFNPIDPEIFFLNDRDQAEDEAAWCRNKRAIKAICGRCPVQAECLEEGFKPFNLDHYAGVYGGMTARARMKRAGVSG